MNQRAERRHAAARAARAEDYLPVVVHCTCISAGERSRARPENERSVTRMPMTRNGRPEQSTMQL